MANEEINNIKSKLVFDPRVARRLIHLGNKVIDIKPYKLDQKQTVIVFEDDEKFQNDFAAISAELKAKDDAKRKPKDDDIAQCSSEFND